MSKMDEWTRKHLRKWIERHVPADEEKWDELEEKMVLKAGEDLDYYLGEGWWKLFNEAGGYNLI